MNTGVYCWLNRRTGKRYVGSAARSLSGRKVDHLSELRRNKSPCTYLQHAWNKYGEKVFAFQVLERCLPKDCLTREQHFIDYYDSANTEHGYNCNPTAGSVLGYRWKRKAPRPPATEETRHRLSAAGMGKRHSEETKAKIAAAMVGKLTGRKLTEEHKLKISASAAKRIHTEETKAKMSKSALARWVQKRLGRLVG